MLNGTPLCLKNEVERGESLTNTSDGFQVIEEEMCGGVFYTSVNDRCKYLLFIFASCL